MIVAPVMSETRMTLSRLGASQASRNHPVSLSSSSGFGGCVGLDLFHVSRLWPACLVRPATILLVELVHFSATCLRIAQVHAFDLFWLDDHYAEVLSCNGMVEIFDFLADRMLLLVIWLVDCLAWRWVLERACMIRMVSLSCAKEAGLDASVGHES